MAKFARLVERNGLRCNYEEILVAETETPPDIERSKGKREEDERAKPGFTSTKSERAGSGDEIVED